MRKMVRIIRLLEYEKKSDYPRFWMGMAAEVDCEEEAIKMAKELKAKYGKWVRDFTYNELNEDYTKKYKEVKINP